ncbi:flagellar biosynthesis protein flir [hydrocarbon metagenome]|uniref:Flagellar biosynthesis protein flir n=1 Tax=hydrocarbon metagenome TaxID=938273 RepID=A0A0W8E5B8_9ZZZZ
MGTFALDSFFLILGRLSGLFISAPIFSSKQIPVTVKALLLAILAATLACFVPVSYGIQVENLGQFTAAMVAEIFVGYIIGFTVYILLGAIQLAGQIMDMQMGFAIVNVVDPQSGAQIPLMGNLTQVLALLMYLAVDGHHYLLQAIVHSYKIIPVLGLNLSGEFYQLIVQISVYMFVIAVKIAAPILVVTMITDIAMGFMARTVPQMNVFIVGLPLKIIVGLVALCIFLPVYLWIFNILFDRFFAYLDQIIMVLGV